MKVLAGDIGGTKTRLALFEGKEGCLEVQAEAVFPSAEFDSLEAIVQAFQRQTSASAAQACFGLAGPVRDGRCHTTNLPWLVDARELERRLGFSQVWLINDLEANAWGISALEPKDFCQLQAGEPAATGNRCVIAAGTGLGQAGLVWDGVRYRPFATEGGHTDFAPRSPLEYALLEYLAERYGHVSWERIVSGPGLVELYRFLCTYRKYVIPAWLAESMLAGDAAAEIAAAGMGRRCPLCVETLELFVSLYGAEAGNLALKHMATGGVFIGGGIAPKLLPKLREGGFMLAFRTKGRMASLLEAMPVQVILNDRTALFGPALYAAAQRDD